MRVPIVAMISTGERRWPPPAPDSASIQADRDTTGIRCMLAPIETFATGQTTLNEGIDACQTPGDILVPG
jgi:hypothetical protein